jgi:hypothetical protein
MIKINYFQRFHIACPCFKRGNFPYVFAIMLISFLIGGCSPDPDRSVRLIRTINSDWTFNYLPFNEPDSIVMLPSYDDSRWQAVAIPHTWSVYETTGEIHPFIYNASERDDPYWWYGWGYYRKRFFIDRSLADKKVFIEFDGVQKYSKVYLNGHYIGDHKGGFTSFYFDITDHILWEEENVLAVAVSNRRNDSQRIPPMTAGNWNVYGGIYRDVRLVVKNRVHIPFQGSYKHEGGTFVTTPRVTKESADVRVITWVTNEQDRGQKVKLKTIVKDAEGKVIKVLTDESVIGPGLLVQFDKLFEDIEQPLLWSPENPYLYSVKSEIFVQGELVDEYESPLGFRYFNWDYENDDLYLNGEKMNILGTNRHQEYPWLGDAHPKWIARMDMYDIKYNLGHNFMRLTHYPNDKYMYQLADTFGLVMVEEVPNIKSIDFDEDVQRQNVVEMIRRDRNHPSIFFWSMGNETTDAADSKWAFEEDSTRIIHLRKGEQGGDYVEHTHENLDMENLLRVTIRGWFDEDDAPEGIDSTPENGQHSSNETWQHRMAMVRGGSVRGLLGDNCVAWLYEDHGADREYKNCILKHINPKGWVDMYRQPKYIYWLTKVNYTGIPTIFIHPHFWRRRYSGQKKDIQVDSNCDKVELFVNGESAGIKYPGRDSFNTLTFKDILIEEGSIKATGTKNGSEFFHEVSMPGDPAEIVLVSEQREIAAGRIGIAIVTANIVDDAGNPVFDANNTLHWDVEGPGKLVGPAVYESDINKIEEMGGTGYTVVPVSNVIRSTNMPGKIKVTVSSEGLAGGELIINSVEKERKVSWLIEPELSDDGREPVRRDKSFSADVLEVPLTILPIEKNHVFDEREPADFRRQSGQFIADRNYGNYNTFVAYKYLLDALAMKLESMNGYLVADDYNFLIGLYNEVVVAEEIIDKNSRLSLSEKEKFKEDHARAALLRGNQTDLEKVIEKFSY